MGLRWCWSQSSPRSLLGLAILRPPPRHHQPPKSITYVCITEYLVFRNLDYRNSFLRKSFTFADFMYMCKMVSVSVPSNWGILANIGFWNQQTGFYKLARWNKITRDTQSFKVSKAVLNSIIYVELDSLQNLLLRIFTANTDYLTIPINCFLNGTNKMFINTCKLYNYLYWMSVYCKYLKYWCWYTCWL